MAQEFKIPGLEKVLTDLDKMHEKVKQNAKDLLDMAVAFEKATPKGKGAENLKPLVEETKKAKIEADKLEIATKKLKDSQSEEARQIAIVTVQIQKQNAENKNYAKANNENSTALDKLNAKINDTTKKSKELGAEMVLLAMDGKKNTQQYKDLEKAFIDASNTSKKLNDSYRSISKTAGDNRALVGSYSEELKGHFEGIKNSFNSMKSNIASGNLGGAFTAGRTIVQGFGESLKNGTIKAKEFGSEMKSNGGNVDGLKTKFSETGESIKKAGSATLVFFKPSEEHSAKMKEGLDRIAIGFKRNNEVLAESTALQTEANVVGEVSNQTAKSGGIFSNLWAGAQLLLAGATGIASGAFGVLAIAVAATGIGAVIIAVALLAEGLSNFRPLMNFLKDGFAGIGAVVEMLSDKITQFVVNIKSFGDLISKLGDIIMHPIDSVKELGKEMSETAKKGAELNEATRKLTAQQKDYAIESKNVENQIRTLMLQAKNRTTTEEERIKLLQKAQDLEAGMHTKKLNMWQSEMDLSLQKLKNEGKITDAQIELLRKGDQAALDSFKKNKIISSGEIDNFRELMDKKTGIEGEGIAIREKTTNQMDMLGDKSEKKKQDADKKAEENAKKALDNQKKLADMAISTMKITLDNEIATYDQSAHLADENIGHIQAISEMKLQIATAEMNKELIGIKQGSLEEKEIRLKNSQEIQKIEIEKNKAIQDSQKENINFELELYEYKNQTLIKDGATINDLLIQQEKDRLQKEYEMNEKSLQLLYKLDVEKVKQKVKTNQALTAAEFEFIKKIEVEEGKKNTDSKKADKLNLDTKLKSVDNELKTENRKFKLLQKGTLANNLFDLKQEKKRLKEEQILQKDDASKQDEIKDNLTENQKNYDKIVSESKKKQLSDGLDAVINFAGQESSIGKAAAIAKTTINTYEAASAILATASASPETVLFPGYPQLMVGLTIASGLAQVAKIAGVDMFEKGTDNAPYTGKAIVDEAGAEIHTDAYGNIKSFGSSDGARFTDIVRGDKIIPADISASIRKSMYASYGMNKNQIDYAILGNEFGKHAKEIVKAIQSKPETNFNFDNGKFNLHVKNGHTTKINLNNRVTFKGKTNA